MLSRFQSQTWVVNLTLCEVVVPPIASPPCQGGQVVTPMIFPRGRAVLTISRLQTRWAKDTVGFCKTRDTTIVQTDVTTRLAIVNTTLSMPL